MPNCSLTLAGLERDCEPSRGGIMRVIAALFESVTGVTITDGKISGITKAPGARFYDYYFRRDSSSYSSTLNTDPSTGLNNVTTDIALKFARMDTAKRIEMSTLSKAGLVLLVQDANKKWWYFGKDEEVRASAGTGATGQARTDENAYTITLQDNSEDWPYEVNVGTGAGAVDIDELLKAA